MNMNTEPDSAVVARIKKLLAITTERGATENEAQVAAAKAAALMEAHGLEMMQIEAAGGEGEAREKDQRETTFAPWYADLMYAVAESCFCHAMVYQTYEHRDDGSRGPKRLRFVLIGRRSAVTSANVMFDYLQLTIRRLARESGVENRKYFRHGCAERVTQRVKQRHVTVLREQREEAERKNREAAARASHPSAAPTSTALVLTLVDYEQSERDANDDFRRGVAPGTTRREREANEAKAALLRELTAKHGWDVAWWMCYHNKTLEEAQALEAESAAARAKSEKSRRSSWTRDDQRRWESSRRQQARADAKRADPSFRAGRSAGESVGLDQQVGRGAQPAPKSSKKIGG